MEDCSYLHHVALKTDITDAMNFRLELHYTALLSEQINFQSAVKLESSVTLQRPACSCVILLRISDVVFKFVSEILIVFMRIQDTSIAE